MNAIDERLKQMAMQRGGVAPTTAGYSISQPQHINIQTPEQLSKAGAAGVGKARPAVRPAIDRVSSDVIARRTAPSIASRAAGAAGKLLNNPLTIGASLLSYSGEVGAGSDIPGGGMPVNPNQMLNQQPTGIGAVPQAQVNQALQPTISELSRRKAQATTMPTAQPQPSVSSPQAQTDADSQAWLAARGVTPGMKNIAGLGQGSIYQTGKNSFVGVGKDGPSEEARQASFAKEQDSNLRNSLMYDATRRGDRKAAELLAQMEGAGQRKSISDLAMQSEQMKLDEARKTASIIDKLPPDQQALARGIGAKQEPRITLKSKAPVEIGKDKDGAPVYGMDMAENETVWNPNTGQVEYTTGQQSAQAKPKYNAKQVVANALKMVNSGKMTREQANAELEANGYPTL